MNEIKIGEVELIGEVKRNSPDDVYRWSWMVTRAGLSTGDEPYWARRPTVAQGQTSNKLYAWWCCRRACRDTARAILGIDQGFTFRYSASYRRDKETTDGHED